MLNFVRGAAAAAVTPRARPGIAIAVICLSNFVASIDMTIVNVALPTLSRVMRADNAELQWVVDAYTLTSAGLLLPAGNLGDRYGRRGWLNIGLALFAATSAIAASANSPGTLIAARAAMGIGAAIIFPTTLALVTNIFTDATQRARAIGVWSAMNGIGIAVGPITGGWLLEHFTLGSIFWINVPIAVTALVGTSLFVPTSRDPDRPPTHSGGLLVSATGVTVLIYTLIEGPNIGWLSVRTGAGFLIAAIMVLLLWWLERHTSHPALDWSIFANRRFSGGSVAVTTAYLALCGFIFIGTQYLQFMTAYLPLETGVRLLPLAFSFAGASVLAPRIVERFGTTSVVTAGLLIFAAALAGSGAFTTHTPYWVIGAAMALLGGGLGLTMAPATEAIMGSLSPSEAGTGSAVTGVTRQLGGCLGVAIVGSVFASVYARSLDGRAALSDLDPAARAALRQSMAAAEHELGRLPTTQAQGLRPLVESAFLDGVWAGCLTCAGVAVAGAIVVAVLLPARPGTSQHRDAGRLM